MRKYLAEAAGGALWSPELFDPASFAARLSGMRQCSTLELLFMLHAANKEVAGEHADSFSELLLWAPVTLRDMAEVDAHLLDHDSFYRDLRAYQDIEEWSMGGSNKLSPSQLRAVHQWDRTRALHARFNELSLAQGKGSSGLLARVALNKVSEPGWSSPWTSVWFAGLNALEPAISKIVRRFTDLSIGQLAWDADRYYFDDGDNEAGRFLRASMVDLGKGTVPVIEAVLSEERTIEQITVPNRIAQAHFAAERLRDLSLEERAQTAVVLADENLLLPLLAALAGDIGPLNVTMGVPLTALPVHGLVEALLGLHAGMVGDAMALDDLERLLLHPLLHHSVEVNSTIDLWRKQGRHRARHPDACEALRGTLGNSASAAERALQPLNSSPALGDRIQQLIAWAVARCGNDRLALEQLYQLAKLERALQRAIASASSDALDPRSYRMIRERALRNERLPLFGEPLAGLQIMGLLETRAIDHERVILLGADEETLASRSQQSWIPFDIRRYNRLPLRADGEAIASYHVHRLLHGAKEICFVHHANDDGKSEPARFLEQWRQELVPRSATRLVQRSLQAPVAFRSSAAIVVEKGPAIMERLAEMASKGFTPSQLGTWLRCPLDFCFKHLMGLQEAAEDEGKLASNVLGTAVHAVLEEVYAAQVGMRVEPRDLLERIPAIPTMLRSQLRKAVDDDALDQGHFKLSMEMAAQAIVAYVEREAERCAVQASVPLALEARLTGILPNRSRLRGSCDRLEDRDGIIHVLDLKTGTATTDKLKLKGLGREQLTREHGHALQLLIYACMVFQNNPALEVLRAGLIPLRKPSLSDGAWLFIDGSPSIERDHLRSIESLLQQLVQDLIDPSIPFRHDPRSEWCSCCIG
ncbi:MAG: PD-(D/E)XK nuclease family protein [Flavobacteriales bacterium]|nr:PD-(D/E)XK nuclease family protein [Flavobacteriales bacterium]